ncbi:hypothetical protein T265_08489 [Opisthorchis viverrini]|uniref:Uncharacterized protein n=1 Tax=Opisthorchis viverrini TaxID=6198 RepID=A0A074ZK17_OPIVI|nr:hypothetical protein T265_08489 [Opisthorchis viverrini]KER23680.1 hypothetical protein T265_08489 [Opisthorchis viverrini]
MSFIEQDKRDKVILLTSTAKHGVKRQRREALVQSFSKKRILIRRTLGKPNLTNPTSQGEDKRITLP